MVEAIDGNTCRSPNGSRDDPVWSDQSLIAIPECMIAAPVRAVPYLQH